MVRDHADCAFVRPKPMCTQRVGRKKILNDLSQKEVRFCCLRMRLGQFLVLKTKKSENNNSRSLLEEEL
jgi:hypothetical protein